MSPVPAIVILCLAWTQYVTVQGASPRLPRSEGLTEEGRRQYEMIQEKLPSYGQCWVEAVAKLHEGCKKLTEEVQSRLALSFADCFLRKAGRRGCACSEDSPVTECLKDVDDTVFTSYREFFTHTQSICFYLQSQAWQDRADKTVLRLTENSEKVSHQLQQSGAIQGEILRLQEKSAESQHKLLENGATLNEELEKSRHRMREVFEEFRTSTGEQRLLVSEVFERVSSLQSLVVGEFTGLYSYIIYLLAVATIYLLTSTPRTSAARFWLLGVWTVNLFVERTLVAYSPPNDSAAGNVFDSSSALYHQVWLIRKVSCILAACLLLWFSSRYKDYNKLNNVLLTEIHRQNEDIKFRLQPIAMTAPQPLQMNGAARNFQTRSPDAYDRSFYDDSDDSMYDSTFVGSSSDSDSDSETSSWASLEPDVSKASTPMRDILPWHLKDSFLSPKETSPQEESLESSRYNLRSRRKVQSPNPVLQKESPRTFEKVVKNLARVSMSNSRKMKQVLESTDCALGDH